MNNDYVPKLLMVELPSGGTLTCAAIFGLDGSLWEQSADFPEPESFDIQSIIRGLDEPSTLATTGIKLGGLKFFLVSSDDKEALYGRSRDTYLFVLKTYTAIIIGISREPVTHGELSVRVRDVGEYLREQNL